MLEELYVKRTLSWKILVQISDEWNIRHLSFIHMWWIALLFNII